jgi:hypothetical protein
MDILPFYRISKPKIEAFATIDTKMRGFVLPRVLKTDGTYRYPLGHTPVENHMTNAFMNGFLIPYVTPAFMRPANISALLYSTTTPGAYPAYHATLTLQVGTGINPVSFSDTSLTSPVNLSNVLAGSSMTRSAVTGDIVLTTARRGPVESAGGRTYYEAGVSRSNLTSPLWGFTVNTTILQSRVLFPSPVFVAEGERLELSYSIVIPTLSVNGIRIETNTQNGMNLSGLLKFSGPNSEIFHPGIESDGILVAPDIAQTVFFSSIPPFGSDHYATAASLSPSTQHADFNQNANRFVDATKCPPIVQPYITDSRNNTLSYTYPVGYPAASTSFRSVCLVTGRDTTSNVYGRLTTRNNCYQLLLDNEMTKTPDMELRFSFSQQF